MLPHVTAVRYVTPLREGGSLPGLMEADDLGTYVVKFVGAGQGRKTLVAEVVSGTLARTLGLPVPDLVTVDVDPALAGGEPDQEVQDLLRASAGLNLGMDYLPRALDFDATVFGVDPALAGRVLWFDALVGNVDRSWRNPNMLYWHGNLHLIDHGATLTFHHNWPGAAKSADRPFDATQHALIACAPAGGEPAAIDAADTELAPRVTDAVLAAAVAEVPDVWLADEPGFDSVDHVRRAYVDRLRARLDARSSWVPPLRETAATARGSRRSVQSNRPAWLESSK
ncbi:HipA family kinase [Cryptosporangium minutisporangium]|uniref:HipA-like kinase domain-containing protein n=1 Tax=Cryptosporangium minutisporangium TaxID=113569 RepID=A0ABP6T708_9ACTN